MTKVCFGREKIDLRHQMEPISQATFQEIMDEEDTEDNKPFFAFARVHSKNSNNNGKQKKQHYTHLYTAENVVNWYPLVGKTDPCTRENIDKIAYFLYMKGQSRAIHVGDVFDVGQNPKRKVVSKTADYFIWSLTADDEPSKMVSLLTIAYAQNLGLHKISSNDKFDTSEVLLQLKDQNNEPNKKERKSDNRSNASKISDYVDAHLSRLAKEGKIECSDVDALLTSIRYDAANHLAGVLVSQDPSVDANSDDLAKIPHIRTNALTISILKHCAFWKVVG